MLTKGRFPPSVSCTFFAIAFLRALYISISNNYYFVIDILPTFSNIISFLKKKFIYMKKMSAVNKDGSCKQR